MRLELLEIELIWPPEVSILDLRQWIKSKLSESGEPLRWAITKVKSISGSESFSELSIEAIVIIAEPLD